MEDILLKYAVALDAGNADGIAEVLKQAETDEGLETSIMALHARYDSNESFTEQLQRTRHALQKEVSS